MNIEEVLRVNNEDKRLVHILRAVQYMRTEILHIELFNPMYFHLSQVVPEDKSDLSIIGGYAECFLRHRQVLKKAIAYYLHRIADNADAQNWFVRAMDYLIGHNLTLPLPEGVSAREVNDRMEIVYRAVVDWRQTGPATPG